MDGVSLKRKTEESAKSGRLLWLDFKAKWGWHDDMVLVLLTEDDMEMVLCALRFLPEYMRSHYIRRGLVIMEEGIAADEIEIKNVDLVSISSSDMEHLLAYYRLTQFAEDIKVFSDKAPFSGGGVVGNAGITMDDYVRDAIFNM